MPKLTRVTRAHTLLAQLRPYTGAFEQDFLEHLGFGKLTWNASGRNTIDVSYSLRKDRDFRNFGGQTSYEARENMDIAVTTGVANWRFAGDRWLNEAQPRTLHELADEFGVSAERIRQIEAKALQKMKKTMGALA